MYKFPSPQKLNPWIWTLRVKNLSVLKLFQTMTLAYRSWRNAKIQSSNLKKQERVKQNNNLEFKKLIKDCARSNDQNEQVNKDMEL